MPGDNRTPHRILVTGAGGFVGRAALAALDGTERIATCRDTPKFETESVTWVQTDLSDPADFAAVVRRHRPTHLLALAWHMGPGNQQALENFRWIQYSIDHLIAFAEAGGRRVTFCGSCAEYDWTGREALNEAATPLAPSSEYGAAKAALFTAFGPLCRKLSLSGAWARPFFLYGPGESPDRLAAHVILSLLGGREALCTHGRQKRDFLHVSDLGEALARLLLSDLEGPLNIASGTATALADLVQEVGRQTGRADLIRLGARQARPDDPPVIEADISRLVDELAWTPRYDLETGLADTIDWWRARLESDMRNGQGVTRA